MSDNHKDVTPGEAVLENITESRVRAMDGGVGLSRNGSGFSPTYKVTVYTSPEKHMSVTLTEEAFLLLINLGNAVV